MAARAFLLLALLPMALSLKLDAAPHKMMLTAQTVKVETVAEMERVFLRSDATHQRAMEAISKSMSLDKALDLVQKNELTNSSNIKDVVMMMNKKHLRKGDHDGFGGLNGARLLLNDMIFEVMVKYDKEIARCTSYYAAQCALMEVARGQISAANYVAATSRALILDAQAMINKCEILIPETKVELKDHNAKCKTELKKLDGKLKIILNDIAVMTMILEMSDCDAKFLQYKKLAMLKCKDQCSNGHSVTFNHKGLQEKMDQLQSPAAKDLLTSTFADMFDDSDSEDTVELMQVDGDDYLKPMVNGKNLLQEGVMAKDDDDQEDDEKEETDAEEEAAEETEDEAAEKEVEAELVQVDQDPKKEAKAPKPPTKTKFNNPPTPKTKVPANPCTDPNQGAPSLSKRGGKCTLKKSPRCYKLQGRFLAIQAEIADARDELMDEIQKLQDSCAETKKTLEDSINQDGTLLSSAQTKLAASMEKEASAGETGRQVAKENQQYNDDLVKTMKTCSTNYADFENEMCALRKIRGDLFKKMKPGHPGFFQDCEVSPWSPETCTKKCAGGDQKLSRSVLTHADGGTKCLPLAAERRCNLGPCPINCILAEWGGWSKCSSKCGGGMATRVRDVKTPMQYGGKQCGPTDEAKQCNVDACEKDCVLHPWTKWTTCSKHCDGGSNMRQRMIKEPAEGSGKCADKWDPTRLEYKACSLHRCKVPKAKFAMKCNQSMDVVIVADLVPRSGKEGFAREIKGINKFIDAWTGKGLTAKPQFALISYTGPRTWSGVSKCTGKSTKKVNMETVCKIKLVQHFTDDIKKIKGKVSGLEFTPGSKLLSLGLMTVESEFALGNKNHRTVVVVWVDGNPLSFRKTLLASRKLRKKARLVWVAVKKFSPLVDLKKWASRRWQENLVIAEKSRDLSRGWMGTRIIANICPREFPKLETSRPKKAR